VQNVFCPFCTSEVAEGTIQCPECGSDLSGILSLIQASEAETTGEESQINVSLSDTAIAGDVNIVQQLQADTDDIVERLVDQLDCFDINKPGLSIPEEGFSRVDIEAAIPLVRENALITIWQIARFDGLACNSQTSRKTTTRARRCQI
jgi:hypothetical protein